MKDRIPVLIDTDLGDDIDDAFALCLAMRSPEIRVLGVTTVFRCAKYRAKMAKALLCAGGFSEIPVYAGESKPLECTSVHGHPLIIPNCLTPMRRNTREWNTTGTMR